MPAENNATASGSATPSSLPQQWVDYITPFATTLKKSVEEVTAALVPLVGEPGDQAIVLLKDASLSPDADIKSRLNGTPIAVANMAIKQLREVAPAAPAAANLAAANFAVATDLLPTVPTDESWLSALRAGGVLKVEQSTVISAVRAALAHRAGLYEIPDRLVGLMERFAESNAEPAPQEFFKIRQLLLRRHYGDIFEAIDGLDGNFVTQARKNILFQRTDQILWPAMLSFHAQLKGWTEAWNQGASNPAVLVGAIASMISGGTGAGMPPGMMAPPDTGTLRDAADAFNDDMNKVFAGTGVQIAAALAYEASRIKTMLENERLPILIGAANREQMLRQLGVEVSAAYPRLETNLTKFVLGIMKAKDVAAGQEEVHYFGALYMLGMQIPWDQLNFGKRSPRAEPRAGKD